MCAYDEDLPPFDSAQRSLRKNTMLNILTEPVIRLDLSGGVRKELLLTQTDEQTLLAIISQRPIPQTKSVRVQGNFDLFEEKVRDLGEDIAPLCKGLEKLMLVDISLDWDHDNGLNPH